MRKCGICCHDQSLFMMNNKFVCLSCDDLLFDIELELDEEGRDTKETGSEVTLKAAVKAPTAA